MPVVPSATSTLTAPNRNGLSAIRGLAYTGDSPPPDYNIVVHDNRHDFLVFIILFVENVIFAAGQSFLWLLPLLDRAVL